MMLAALLIAPEIEVDRNVSAATIASATIARIRAYSAAEAPDSSLRNCVSIFMSRSLFVVQREETPRTFRSRRRSPEERLAGSDDVGSRVDRARDRARQERKRRHDRQGDDGEDQGVLGRRGAGLVPEKLADATHWVDPFTS